MEKSEIFEQTGVYQIAPALCLDLDGTVRHSKNGRFINAPEDVIVYGDVEQKLWEYRDKGFLIFGVTNQGGVAYGLKTPEGHQAEIDAMFAQFESNPFHGIQVCFHHPDGYREPYKHRSLFRKPYPGMLMKCELDAWNAGYVVDWDNSLMVGDRPEDDQCASGADVTFQWAFDFFERL